MYFNFYVDDQGKHRAMTISILKGKEIGIEIFTVSVYFVVSNAEYLLFSMKTKPLNRAFASHFLDSSTYIHTKP